MHDNEEPKRLAPTKDTLRELFLKSGNLCAFPGCNHLMMNLDGVFIGQICHIEAAEMGGPRFNRTMSNEERRNSSNLMLMCHEHHKVTDDELRFPVNALKQMKGDHEASFSSPERSMLESIQDWTQRNQPTFPKNLNKFVGVLEIRVDENELSTLISDLCNYIERFRSIPIQLREFFSAVIERIQRMQHTDVVQKFGWSEQAILISDITGAFGLSEIDVFNFASQLENYRVAGVAEIDTYSGEKPAIALYDVNDWPFWSDLALFCEKTGQNIREFAIDLDFGRLDT